MFLNLMATMLVATSIGAPINEDTTFETNETTITRRNANLVNTTLYIEGAELELPMPNLANLLATLTTSQEQDLSETDIMYTGEGDTAVFESINENYLQFSDTDHNALITFEISGDKQWHFVVNSVEQTPQDSEWSFGNNTLELANAIVEAINTDMYGEPPSITDNIFSTIGQTITGMINNLSSALGGVTGLFWNSTESKLTILGVLSVIAVGAGLVYFVFNLIRGLLSKGARA